MFGIVTTFKLREPLTAEEIEEIRRQAIEPMTRQPGFRHYHVVQNEAGLIGSFHAWDSRSQAEAALADMSPKLAPLLEHKLLEPPQRIMSEIVAEY